MNNYKLIPIIIITKLINSLCPFMLVCKLTGARRSISPEGTWTAP